MVPDVRRWHHAILTTYGAWLPGDARGYRTRYHRGHVDGDYKSPPPQDQYTGLERSARESLTQEPVHLPPELRPVVGVAIEAKLTHLGAWLLCAAVSGKHVHLLVKMPRGDARNWLGMAKKHTTFELRECGFCGKLWGVRSKIVLITSRQQQVNTYRYILRHGKEGAWVGDWKQERERGMES